MWVAFKKKDNEFPVLCCLSSFEASPLNQTNEGKGGVGAKRKYLSNWPKYNQRVDAAKDEEGKSQRICISICKSKLLIQKVNS